MSELDVEGVLAGHRSLMVYGSGDVVCICDSIPPRHRYTEAEHRAHVAAVLREQIAAWLMAEGKREMYERGGH